VRRKSAADPTVHSSKRTPERAEVMQVLSQIARFGVIGLASNLLLYFIYLGATALGVEYKIAMTILYVAAVLITFACNRAWRFKNCGPAGVAFPRYVGLYLLGYIVNFCSLIIFVDWLHYPHQIVQGLMILLVAALLFSMQKLWVFNHGRDA
jgi:putative flippase GtrA